MPAHQRPWHPIAGRLVPVLRSTALMVALGCQPATAPESESIGLAVQATATNHALGFRQAYVLVPDHPDLDLQTTWTLEAWVYPRSAGNGVDQDIISKWDGATDAAY